MTKPHGWSRWLPALFWTGALAGALVMARVHYNPPGWDLQVYANAVHSLRAGHDPYADGVAVQQAYHAHIAAHLDPDAMPPYTYVYAPITLPLVRAIGHLPGDLTRSMYWVLFGLGVFAMAIAWIRLVEPRERRGFALFAPAALFFPGLLREDLYLSGNIAYILYALILAAALLGWRRERWLPFYAAVLLASCFKAPLLSLVLLAPLSARRQWLWAVITGALGVAVFAMQRLLWAELFRHYLQAVQLQFDYNHDFGLSPAGLLGSALSDAHLPYSPWVTIAYLAYALPLFALLVYLAHRFFLGAFSLEQWAPVLVVGVILLNPRIKEYDVAPLAMPMALIAWRLLARDDRRGQSLAKAALGLLALNLLARVPGVGWKPLEAAVLVGVFGGGMWALLHPSFAEARHPKDIGRCGGSGLTMTCRSPAMSAEQLRTD